MISKYITTGLSIPLLSVIHEYSVKEYLDRKNPGLLLKTTFWQQQVFRWSNSVKMFFSVVNKNEGR